MSIGLWIAGAYLCGSIPFSVWLGRLLLRAEIRRFGDGNPGGTNVIRAGGTVLGIVVILLDALKGLLPIVLARNYGQLGSWPLTAVALAAIVGHAFTVFLGFRGGKAVAVTFGVWGGLTGWPTLLLLGGLLLAAYLLLTIDGWAVMLTLCGLLAFLVAFDAGQASLSVWLGNFLILAWKHRKDLKCRPGLKPWAR